jgi:hypothetical protein
MRAPLGQHVLNGPYYPLPYDVLNDFAPVLPVARFPAVLFQGKPCQRRTWAN